MPCVNIPRPPLPELPQGFSFTPPLPSLPTSDLQFPCCIKADLQIPPIPIPLGPIVINAAFLATLRAALAAAEAYFDQIPTDCPRTITATT